MNTASLPNLSTSVLCGPAASAQPENLAEMHNLGQDAAGVGRDGRMELTLQGRYPRYLKETIFLIQVVM